MSDVLRTLREARPDELAPDAPVDPEVRRAELARAMAGAPGGAAGRAVPVPRTAARRWRPVWGLGLAGAAVAAALVAVSLPAADDAGPGPGTPAAGGPVRTLDAGTVLLAAAAKTETRPAGAGAYWRVAKVESSYYEVGEPGARYTVVLGSEQETWTPREPGGRAWTRQRSLGARAATPADAAAWRRAGSPTTFSIEVPTKPGGGKLKPLQASTAPGPVETQSSPLVDGDKVFWLGRNVTMADLQALPADPAKLKAELLRWYEGHDTESAERPMSADAWLYRTSVGLVTDMPVEPRVRAAAFRMLAGLASVEGVGEITDSRGRTGQAVAFDEETPLGTIRHRLVIDPASGRTLADERVLLEPAPGVQRPAGTVLSSAAVTAMEWTDSAPR
ncbi:CU044_5270 family protein [Spirillospora sp. NPDC052242]